MFCFWKCQSNIDPSVHPFNYTAAGVLFTDGESVLAGLQADSNDTKSLSGFGGAKESGETYMDTSLRELVEEFFDSTAVPKKLIDTLKQKLKPYYIYQVDTYIIVVYTFKQLRTMLRIIAKSGLQSRLYDTIPLEVYELILYRYPITDCEILNITMIPMNIQYPYASIINKDFQMDLKLYKKILDARHQGSICSMKHRSKSESKDK
jgi:hypothetical protein